MSEVARIFGTPSAVIPGSLREFREYIAAQIASGPITATAPARDVAAVILAAPLPAPMRVLLPAHRLATAGALPPRWERRLRGQRFARAPCRGSPKGTGRRRCVAARMSRRAPGQTADPWNAHLGDGPQRRGTDCSRHGAVAWRSVTRRGEPRPSHTPAMIEAPGNVQRVSPGMDRGSCGAEGSPGLGHATRARSRSPRRVRSDRLLSRFAARGARKTGTRSSRSGEDHVGLGVIGRAPPASRRGALPFGC